MGSFPCPIPVTAIGLGQSTPEVDEGDADERGPGTGSRPTGARTRVNDLEWRAGHTTIGGGGHLWIYPR